MKITCQKTQEIVKNNENNDRMAELQRLVMVGIDSWIEAGKIVVEEMAKNPNFPSDVEAYTQGQIKADIIKQLQKVGLKLISPKLVALYNGSKASQKLSQLPVQLQEKYLGEPFDVLTYNDQTKTYQNIKVKHEHLTGFQIRQVFYGNTVRSVAAQEAWIKSGKTVRHTTEVKVKAEYVVCGGEITFRKGSKFKLDDLVKILSSHLKS
jgi:hypothetical protein